MAPRTRRKQLKKKQQPAAEAAGQAFQRVTAALAAEDRLDPELAAAADEWWAYTHIKVSCQRRVPAKQLT